MYDKSIAAISDHKRWDYDEAAYGVKEIHSIYDHFKIPLDENNFNNDLAVKEFRDIKRIVQHRYKHQSNVGINNHRSSKSKKYHFCRRANSLYRMGIFNS